MFSAVFAAAQRGGLLAQQLTFTPSHATGIYDVGETIGWTVTPGPTEPTYVPIGPSRKVVQGARVSKAHFEEVRGLAIGIAHRRIVPRRIAGGLGRQLLAGGEFKPNEMK